MRASQWQTFAEQQAAQARRAERRWARATWALVATLVALAGVVLAVSWGWWPW